LLEAGRETPHAVSQRLKGAGEGRENLPSSLVGSLAGSAPGADKDRNGREACKCMECKFYGTQGPSGLRTWQMGLMKGGQLSEGQQ